MLKTRKSWSSVFSSSSWKRSKVMTASYIPMLTETIPVSTSSYLHPLAPLPQITRGKTSPMQPTNGHHLWETLQGSSEHSALLRGPCQEKGAPALVGRVTVSSHSENNRGFWSCVFLRKATFKEYKSVPFFLLLFLPLLKSKLLPYCYCIWNNFHRKNSCISSQ